MLLCFNEGPSEERLKEMGDCMSPFQIFYIDLSQSIEDPASVTVKYHSSFVFFLLLKYHSSYEEKNINKSDCPLWEYNTQCAYLQKGVFIIYY